MKETLKVKDWSQPYKLALMVIGLVVIAASCYALLDMVQTINDNVSSVNDGVQNTLTLGRLIKGPTELTNANTNALVTSTAIKVLSAWNAADVRCFGNASGTVTLYLGFGTSTSLTAGKGYSLTASSTACFSGDSLWKGDVYAIADAAGGANLSMSQY